MAAYLVEKWKTALTVLTLSGNTNTPIQDYVRSYLDLHEIQADFIVKSGSREAALKIIKERQINLVLMGGYGGTALKGILVESMVNFLLRRANCPLLICR